MIHDSPEGQTQYESTTPATGHAERASTQQDYDLCVEGYYCQCDEVATQEELDWNKCAACGKQLW